MDPTNGMIFGAQSIIPGARTVLTMIMTTKAGLNGSDPMAKDMRKGQENTTMEEKEQKEELSLMEEEKKLTT